MPIRHAVWSDLLPTAYLASRAMWDDPVFGVLRHPNRTLHPTALPMFLLRFLRSSYFSPTCTILISHPESNPHTITGAAIWERRGEGASQLEKQQSWRSWMAAKLVNVWNFVNETIFPNLAMDPEIEKVAHEPYRLNQWRWEEEGRKAYWWLHLLATESVERGKGYGRAMVGWGIQRAKEEGVCASLCSAVGKEEFYVRCGFLEPVGWMSEGEGNPLAHWPGGAVMFTETFRKEERYSDEV